MSTLHATAPEATRPWLARSPWGFPTEFGVLLLVVGGLFALLSPIAGEDLLKYQFMIWSINVVMLTLIWLGVRLRGERLGSLGLAAPFARRGAVLRLLWQSGITFILSLVAFMFGAVVMGIILGRPEQADMSGYNPFRGNLALLVPVLLAVYVVSSFGEELIYRGFLITRIEAWMPWRRGATVISVLTSAVVFGLIHFSWGPAGMVQTGCMGLALALSYLAFGRNLWVNVLAHMYLDTLLMLQVFLAPAA